MYHERECVLVHLARPLLVYNLGLINRQGSMYSSGLIPLYSRMSDLVLASIQFWNYYMFFLWISTILLHSMLTLILFFINHKFLHIQVLSQYTWEDHFLPPLVMVKQFYTTIRWTTILLTLYLQSNWFRAGTYSMPSFNNPLCQ